MNAINTNPRYLEVAPNGVREGIELDEADIRVDFCKIVPRRGWRESAESRANPELTLVIGGTLDIGGTTFRTNIYVDDACGADGVNLPDEIATGKLYPVNGRAFDDETESRRTNAPARAAVDAKGDIVLDADGRPVVSKDEPVGTSHLAVARMVGLKFNSYLKARGALVRPAARETSPGVWEPVVNNDGVQFVTIDAETLVPYVRGPNLKLGKRVAL